MAPDYIIPDETTARTASHLSAYYQTRLDEESRRGRVIDVQARRVMLDERAAGNARRAHNVDARVRPEATREERRSDRTRTEHANRERPEDLEGTFAYSPDRLTEGIALKNSPKARGLFIDLMA